MTRGQIVIITNNGLYTSIEFNGDMYYSVYGKQVIEGLEKVQSYEEYKQFVKEFYVEYNDDMCCEECNGDLVYELASTDTEKDIERIKKFLTMGKDYFDNWFSDYLYIKNISDEDWEITLDNDDWAITLKPNDICSLKFGNLDYKWDGNNKLKRRVKNSIVEAIESLGWGVEQDDNYFTIEQWSPAGEDICETFDYNKPIAEQAQNIYDYFNPDEHAAEWFGQGVGEPSGLRDLLDDADAIKHMYYELWLKLSELSK